MEKVEIGKPLFNSLYIVDSKIGEGNESNVYNVHVKDQPHLKYAAKIIKKPEKIDDEYWNRYGDEAVTNSRISKSNNPNVVKTYEVLIANDETIVFIQDLVKGRSLRYYLFDHKCLIPRKALGVFLKILNGVHELHHFKHKIIHRDLKPENVMVTEDLSSVVILDFGISTVIRQDIENGEKKIITTDKETRGTFPYIAPDNIDLNIKNVTVQSDFYSLGVILYEMIMGEVPFKKVTKADGKLDHNKTIRLPLQYDIPNISQNPSIPVMLENIIFRCMASKPEDIKYRYNSCEEIIEDVKKCLLLINKKDDDTQLLKPVTKRIYQNDFKFKIEKTKSEVKGIKQWWVMALITSLGVAVIVACIIFLFVI